MRDRNVSVSGSKSSLAPHLRFVREWIGEDPIEALDHLATSGKVARRQ